MPDAQLERADGGLLRTDADLDDADAEGPFPVWAQIFAPGDVTRGKDGTGDDGGDRKENASHWTPETLERDISVFGPSEKFQKHMIEGHPQNPTISDIRGEALEATFDDELGVVVQGEVDDRETAKLIDRGRIGISPWIYREHGDYNEEKDAYDVSKVLGVRDYGLVRNGENVNAEINLGESPLSRANADAADAPTAEALSGAFDPASDEDGAHAGARGDTNPDSGESPGRKMPDNPDPDNHSVEELLARIERLESERDELREKVDEDKDETIEELRQRISALEDDKESLEEENEQLEEDVEPMETAAAEALGAEMGLDVEEVRDRWDGPSDMVSTLTDGQDEPDDIQEVLGWTADPQSGAADPTDDNTNGGLGNLSEQDEQQIEVLAADADHLDGIDDESAEAYREEAAEIAGVEDFSELEGEVV